MGTVALYGYLTFAISDWRIGHRRALNEADAEAAGRAVDAWLNYETVKSFGGEARAVGGYAGALDRYGEAQIKATNSLNLLEPDPVGGDVAWGWAAWRCWRAPRPPPARSVRATSPPF
jgi:ABC-type transport system involved in Fe-S cluster assembly fused permease/ATPase subunit